MFNKLVTSCIRCNVGNSSVTRSFSSTKNVSAKVAVLGAAGGIGQPLSLLCKLSDHVDELSCYDIVGTPGVAADLSHVRVSPFFKKDILKLRGLRSHYGL